MLILRRQTLWALVSVPDPDTLTYSQTWDRDCMRTPVYATVVEQWRTSCERQSIPRQISRTITLRFFPRCMCGDICWVAFSLITVSVYLKKLYRWLPWRFQSSTSCWTLVPTYIHMKTLLHSWLGKNNVDDHTSQHLERYTKFLTTLSWLQSWFGCPLTTSRMSANVCTPLFISVYLYLCRSLSCDSHEAQELVLRTCNRLQGFWLLCNSVV